MKNTLSRAMVNLEITFWEIYILCQYYIRKENLHRKHLITYLLFYIDNIDSPSQLKQYMLPNHAVVFATVLTVPFFISSEQIKIRNRHLVGVIVSVSA